jgi:AAA15 family ATPase/GTPase
MIEELEIVNFKSIKNLRLRCKRVNLLIGEPNTGKSNILEALGLLSSCAFPTDFQKIRTFRRHEPSLLPAIVGEACGDFVGWKEGNSRVS